MTSSINLEEEKMTLHWFNITIGDGNILGRRVTLFEAFNRVCADGDHYWGIGVLQLGQRWLFYVGYNSVSILFIGKSE